MGPRHSGGQAAHAGVRRRPEHLRSHGSRRAHQDQERDGLDSHVQEVLQGGHLRIVRDEHRRGQHPGLHQVRVPRLFEQKF